MVRGWSDEVDADGGGMGEAIDSGADDASGKEIACVCGTFVGL